MRMCICMLYMLAREMARGGAEGVGGEVGEAMRPNEDSGRRAMPADCLPILRSASHRSRQMCSCPAIPVSHVSTPGCRTALVGGASHARADFRHNLSYSATLPAHFACSFDACSLQRVVVVARCSVAMRSRKRAREHDAENASIFVCRDCASSNWHKIFNCSIEFYLTPPCFP